MSEELNRVKSFANIPEQKEAAEQGSNEPEIDDDGESNDENFLKEVFKPRGQWEERQHETALKRAKELEEARRRDEEDFRADPEWYAMKHAARSERQEPHEDTEGSKIGAAPVAPAPVEASAEAAKRARSR